MNPTPRSLFLGFLYSVLGLMLVGCTSLDQGGRDDRFLYLDTADTLQIRFHYSADASLQMASSSLAETLEELRYRDYDQVMGPLLSIIGLPMKYRLLEEHERVDDGHPVLDLHVLRWDDNRLGEIEIVLQASITSYGEKNRLGVFSEREMRPVAFSNDRRDQVYQKVLRQSLTEMLHALLDHFELPESSAIGEET